MTGKPLLHLFHLSGNMMKNVRTLLKERDPLLFAYLVKCLSLAKHFKANIIIVMQVDLLQSGSFLIRAQALDIILKQIL